MASDRKSLLRLYKTILRSAQTYPSVKQPQIYQSIREEWRENKTMTDPKKLEIQIAVAYKGVEQLRQFDVQTMTKGNIHSAQWEVNMEQNPMPKPADYDERKHKREGRR